MQIYVLLFILIFFIVMAIVRWFRNENSPVCRVSATVIGMRRKKHMRARYRSYHVTFLLESGEQMELRIMHNEYDTITIGDNGMLTHKGTRYKSFER